MINHTLRDILTAFAQGQTKFDNALIKNANLQARLLPLIRFRKACLPAADFRHAILPGADFEGAMLEGSNLEHANLLASNLAWANLAQANLGHTLLSSSTLIGANLANANLSGAAMLGVDLTSANLRNANLSGVNLKGANLSKANLFGARIDVKALSEAFLEFTIMPSGDCISSNQAQPPTPPPATNLTSYTHLAPVSDQQRQASDTNNHPPATAPKTAPASSAPVPDRPSTKSQPHKHIWFQFTENSADLDLRVTTPQEC